MRGDEDNFAFFEIQVSHLNQICYSLLVAHSSRLYLISRKSSYGGGGTSDMNSTDANHGGL